MYNQIILICCFILIIILVISILCISLFQESYHNGNSKSDKPKPKSDKSNPKPKSDKSNPKSDKGFLLKDTPPSYLKWKHKDAADYLLKIIQLVGPPSSIDIAPGGMAIWKKEDLKDTCYVRLELLDESIPHCRPKPHNDFFYTYVHYEIPMDTFQDVLILSGSVTYDPLKKWLRARCGSIEANNATLLLAIEIATKKFSIDQVQKENIYTHYILSTANHEKSKKQYKTLCHLIRTQKKVLPKRYFPLAFPQGC